MFKCILPLCYAIKAVFGLSHIMNPASFACDKVNQIATLTVHVLKWFQASVIM